MTKNAIAYEMTKNALITKDMFVQMSICDSLKILMKIVIDHETFHNRNVRTCHVGHVIKSFCLVRKHMMNLVLCNFVVEQIDK